MLSAEEVTDHLHAAGVRPLYVGELRRGSSTMSIYLQSTFGDQDLALEVVRQLAGVQSADFSKASSSRSILHVELEQP